MTKAVIASIAIALCCIILTSCTKEVDRGDSSALNRYCSAIIDASVMGIKSDIITSECFQQLQAAGNPGGFFDSKEITTIGVNEDGKYICVCNAKYMFNNTDNTWYFTYKISFTLDEDVITTAEVINYAKY